MAEQFGVSRTSVREALLVLEALGVVRSGVGSGPESGTFITADPSVALDSSIRLHIASQQISVADVVGTRVLMEGWACAHADPQAGSLDEAQTLLAAMDEVEASAADEFLDLDARFHYALTRAAGNPLVSAIMASLRGSIRDYTAEIMSRQAGWPEIAQSLQKEHRGILHAVRQGDQPEAVRLVTGHIEGFHALARNAAPDDAAESAAGGRLQSH